MILIHSLDNVILPFISGVLCTIGQRRFSFVSGEPCTETKAHWFKPKSLFYQAWQHRVLTQIPTLFYRAKFALHYASIQIGKNLQGLANLEGLAREFYRVFSISA